MAARTTYTVKLGEGAAVSSGYSVGGGVSVGSVGNGVGVTTPIGSASLTRIGSGASVTSNSYNAAATARIGSGASVSSSRVSIGSGASTPIVSGTGGYSSMTTTTRTTKIQSTAPSVGGGATVGTAVDYAKVAVSGAQIFAEATQREKEEMQRLNDRLSGYIARVKQLEEQHKMLIDSLSNIRGKWNTKNDDFKSNYSVTISDVRKERTDATRVRIANDIRVNRLKTDIAELKARTDEMHRLADTERKRIPQWMAAISEADDELAKLTKRFGVLKNEEANALNDQSRLLKELADLNLQLDGIMGDKLTFQSQVSSISDELKFLKKVHEEEVRELQGLLVVAPADTKEFFRNELALAIRDIRKEYELLASAGKTKLESWYMTKVQSIQSISERRNDDSAMYMKQVTSLKTATDELNAKYKKMEKDNSDLEVTVARLQMELESDHSAFEDALVERDQILIRMREECAVLVAELQALLDSKALLDGEIAIYRAMIEGEGRRVGVVVQETQVQQDTEGHGEVAMRTKFDTIAHGHVAITQSDPAGRFVSVANNSQHVDERIGGWRIKRTIDNNREFNFYFPAGTVLKPGQKISVFARGQGSVGPNALVFETESSWGLGPHVVTALYDGAGAEKAVYTQNTVMESV